jgi:sulfite exporter TauE/SafE
MDFNVLLATAIAIGLIHTLLGPDHYLPFIVMRRARGWSIGKTTFITIFCGIGHVLGSVILGLVGITFGIGIGFLEKLEAARGSMASWLLIGLGLAYAVWGLRLGLRASRHTHDHQHEGDRHLHPHHHLGRHAHVHGDPQSITPWALFIIFVLGPCEPLIPILMYPAAQGSPAEVFYVIMAFGVVTIATMTGIVIIISTGVAQINLGPLERYTHALAGIIIAASGLAIELFGL